MVIAVDLDGVVFDTEEYFRTYAHIYDIYKVKNGLVKKDGMTFIERHAWTQEESDIFYKSYTPLILNNAPIKPGVKYVLNELKNMGHKLICITLRGFFNENEIEITERRLKEENIVFDKIIYKESNKAKACKEENVGVIIEDNNNNIKYLTDNKIKCLHFRAIGLKKVRNKYVTEVHNWAEILEYFKKAGKNGK